MRKFLLCALITGFLMVTAMPVSAVHIRSAADKGISEIEIGGELLTRGWLLDETYTNDRRGGATGGDQETKSNKTNSFWQSNFILDTAYVASENLKGVWTIEIEDIIWGDETSGGGLGTNEANILTNQLFVEFKVPTVPVTARVGLQNYTLGHSVILDDEAGGVNLNVAVDPLDVNLFTFKRNEGDFDTYDDTDYYGATFNASLGDLGSVGLFTIFGHANGAGPAAARFFEDYETAGIFEDLYGVDEADLTDMEYFDRYDAWWYGLTADLAMDPIEIALEADFYQARWNAETGNRDFHASGWFVWLDAGANIGDLGKAGIAGFVASGNPNDSYVNNDGSPSFASNNFTRIDALDRTDGCVLDWDNLFVRDGVAYNNSARLDEPATDNDNVLRNMVSGKIYATLNPVDWLSTGFNANMYWKLNDYRGEEDGERNFYGYEVDLDVAVQIYDQLVWSIEGGYMFTYDDAFDPDPHQPGNSIIKAVGVDNTENDENSVDDIWAVTSTLVYSF
jgi:hypothetical protein